MKKLLSAIAGSLLVLCLPLLAQAQNYKVMIEDVPHCTFRVSYSAGGVEKTVANGDEVANLTFLSISATVEEGWTLTEFLINGDSKEPSALNNTHCMVMSNVQISATVVKSELRTLTIKQPEHGSIKVNNGPQEVASGDKVMSGTTLKITVIPDEGYVIDQWIIDGNLVRPSDYSPTTRFQKS